MERPNIEEYERRLHGSKGQAWAKHMEHVEMKPLLEYIKYLEVNLCKCSKELK